MMYFVLFVSFSICSTTLLWRIETKPPSYIFGSIHVPYNVVWPYVSNETRRAFMLSTHFYGEIDAKNDAYWDNFLQCIVNRSTRTRRLSNSLNDGDIIDTYLSVEARRLNKTVGSLETPESHCEREGWRYNLTTWTLLIDSVKEDMRDGIFTSFNRIKYYLKQPLVKKYICEEITGQYIETLYKSATNIQHLEQRDEQMSRYIHTLLHYSKNNRYFFAIGAAHMLGKHKNIIIRLKKFGYKITRICTNRNHIKKKFGCKKKKITKHCIKKSFSNFIL